MTGIELKITSEVKNLSGPGSQQINKIIKDIVLPVVITQITDAIHIKAIEFASGISMPEQKVPGQATHRIGQSVSQYQLTGALAESIKISEMGKDRSIISTDLEYASWVEFGTGIFGPRGQLIFPTKGSLMVFPFQGKTIAASFTLGQPPQPFMRGSMWYLIDNFTPTKEKIELKFRSI